MTENKRLGGWQFWVDLYDDYVIKTPKNRNEIKEEVEKFLRWKNKLDELNERTDKMIFDIKNATKIIKKSKIPKRYLANIEFLEDGKIKQKRVKSLDGVLKKLSKKQRLELIDKIAKFLLEMWKYGIHEYTYKVFSNLGLKKERIVFIDPFEITSNKNKVLKQIKKQKWAKPEKYQKHLSDNEIDYLMTKLKKTFTQKNLNKYWKTK
ncbi:hypothetical protein CMI41_00065 [Candidatus Pacearchaeota archaeon]|nr:hypothetical protein [Candidatus Pacearchaeota archaeon]|tara:strand:+ start:225 stop:845 length:621 start_codon:yes stop_codon:yes gene_type:complete